MSINPIFAKYSQKNDASLLKLYRDGDQVACAALLAKYASVVNKRISNYSIKGVDNDDLKQEAFMGLLSAIRSFDESKKASFFTYANHCITNRLKNLLAAALTNKSTIYNKSISFDEMEDDIVSDNYVQSPELIFIQNEGYSALVDLIEQHLSKSEKDVLFLYLSGCEYSTVAKKLDFSQKAVDNALQRARRKLKVVLNNL
ncbi:MAG: sigma-70 family RNA polymerase sigma factor [Oscillospiraceae bacterium]